MIEKQEKAYKSISEVAKILNLVNKKTGKINTHTLRFWEKHFKQIKPKIFSGKRRYYDLNSIKVLKKIKYLLKDQGMTINGVKKSLYKEKFLELDELDNRSINNKNIMLKSKLTKISKLIKEIKKLG
tara:strand:+ start:1335 stop:1715 length:381 start_codon:yes stop_codon:yes gene_type:complete